MMTISSDFRRADASDLDAIHVLLKRAGLPFEDLAAPALRNFIVLPNAAGELLAVGGIEIHGRDGLLRSVVVSDEVRGSGLGETTVRMLEQHARAEGLRALYLLTTTAATFFPRLGYVRHDRAAVPAAIAQSAEFASLCPDSAVCMKKNLSEAA